MACPRCLMYIMSRSYLNSKIERQTLCFHAFKHNDITGICLINFCIHYKKDVRQYLTVMTSGLLTINDSILFPVTSCFEFPFPLAQHAR